MIKTLNSLDKGGLRPNNTTYTGAFGVYSLWITDTDAAGGSILSTADAIDHFSLFEGRADRVSMRVSTSTTSKTAVGSILFATNVKSGRFSRDSIWKDTSTPWTSLGTIVFPFAQSGRIIIRRIA